MRSKINMILDFINMGILSISETLKEPKKGDFLSFSVILFNLRFYMTLSLFT